MDAIKFKVISSSHDLSLQTDLSSSAKSVTKFLLYHNSKKKSYTFKKQIINIKNASYPFEKFKRQVNKLQKFYCITILTK
jgi:hypothetical protein